MCPFGRRPGVACFQIGSSRGRKPQSRKALLAAFVHAIERGEVLAVLDSELGTLKNLRGRDISERFQPQLFNLTQLLCFAERRVVLVVIVQAKKREDLIYRLY